MFMAMEISNKIIATLLLLVISNVAAESATRSSYRYLRNGRLLEEKSSCNVDVQFGDCPISEISLDNDCLNPFQVITFRYNGGNCIQSNNFLQRHEFTCDDTNGGPPTLSSSSSDVRSVVTPVTNYITVTSQSGNETYFAGNVSVGDEYTLNADEEYPVLIGEMIISIYETQGGNILQKTNLLLDCTSPLFLFDKFGASQVIYWKEIDGREVKVPDISRNGSITVMVNNPDDTSTIRLVQMSLLTNIQDSPVDYTQEVKDVILQPQQTISLTDVEFQYDYGVGRTRYTFFTTIIGESFDGSAECNDYATLECII